MITLKEKQVLLAIILSINFVVTVSCFGSLESPLIEMSPKVSDLRPTTQHKMAWLSEEGSRGTKSTAPQRYLSKKDTDGRTGQYIILVARVPLKINDINFINSDSVHNRLSMDPSARVKLSKLEWVSCPSAVVYS